MCLCMFLYAYGCVCARSKMCTLLCETDATACRTSLTEESSGMEVDYMVTGAVVPDALAVKEGIG